MHSFILTAFECWIVGVFIASGVGSFFSY